jgi:hypothetical protein
MSMRIHLFFAAFVALMFASASGADAQTVIAQDGVVPIPATTVVTQPVAVAPVETVRTTRSVTVPRHRYVSRRPRRHTVRRVTTTRTIVRQAVAPATAAVVATPAVAAVPAYSGPLYNAVPPAPPPAMSVVQPIAAAPVAVAPPVPVYRYVYEPDRILVIDPNTGIAVQALPR